MTSDDVPTIFGPAWGHMPVVAFPETPTYALCRRCNQRILDGDRGFIREENTVVDAAYLVGVGESGPLTAIHRECDLAAVIGPVVGVDAAHGWDTSHESALEAERRWLELRRTHGESVTDARRRTDVKDHPS